MRTSLLLAAALVISCADPAPGGGVDAAGEGGTTARDTRVEAPPADLRVTPDVALNPQIAALGDGESVVLQTSAPAPLGRGFSPRMPYDPVHRVGLVYGASHTTGSTLQNDLWSFDAATGTWTELMPADPSPLALKYNQYGVLVPASGPLRPPGVGHTYNVITFDASLGKMVSLRGGTPAWLYCYATEKAAKISEALAAGATQEMIDNARACLPWLFDVGTRSWALACPESGQTPYHARAEAAVYDPDHRRVLFWSVDETMNLKNGVFAYDGSTNTWTFQATKAPPPPGIENLATWDSVNRRVLYFSGNYTDKRTAGAFDYPSITWTTLAGQDWPKDASGAGVLFAAADSTLAFDTRNGVALLFKLQGGVVRAYPYDVAGDRFQPAVVVSWTPAQGSIRSYYDPQQNAVILHGGGDLAKTTTAAFRYRR